MQIQESVLVEVRPVDEHTDTQWIKDELCGLIERRWNVTARPVTEEKDSP